MRFGLSEKPRRIICGIDEQPFLTLLVSDQITEDCKISYLILFDNHLLPPNPSRSSKTIIYELRNFNFLFDSNHLYHLMEEKEGYCGVGKVRRNSIG
jgi:hypothetical protein